MKGRIIQFLLIPFKFNIHNLKFKITFHYFCNMPLSPDPFGTAVMDFPEGKHDPIIQVSSNLGEDVETIPVAYLFRNWEEMPE